MGEVFNEIFREDNRRAGIALNYMAGIAALWFGAVCMLLALVIWSVAGSDSLPYSFLRFLDWRLWAAGSGWFGAARFSESC